MLLLLVISFACADVAFNSYLTNRNRRYVPPTAPPVNVTTQRASPAVVRNSTRTAHYQPAPVPRAQGAGTVIQKEKKVPYTAPRQQRVTTAAAPREIDPPLKSTLHCDAERLAAAIRNVGAHNKTLLIAVPTVGRPKQQNYLHPLINGMLDQIIPADNQHYFSSIKILVISFEPLTHNKAFADLHNEWHLSLPHDRLRRYVELLELGDSVRLRDTNPEYFEPRTLLQVDKRKRQQTLDFILMLALLEQRSAHINIVVEDDVVMCRDAMPRIVDDICFLDAVHGTHWSTLRLGLGFMGIALPHAKLRSLRRFWQRYYLMKPCDLLHDDWAYGTCPGASRYGDSLATVPTQPMTPMAYNTDIHNTMPRQMPRDVPAQEQLVMFGHRGMVSSIGNSYNDAPYACHKQMRQSWVQSVNNLYEKRCDKFNVWPCY